MRGYRGFLAGIVLSGMAFSATAAWAGGQDYSGNEDPNKKILKQGLLGAGVGAISAEASGGKAGTGALVGAGTNVIGGALLDTLTSSSAPRPQQVQYVQAVPVQQQVQASYPVQPTTTYPSEPQPVYYQQAPSYAPPQEDPTKRILKQGLLGAGTGAIAASASGGKAGKGALIGAGTNVIGGALLDMLSGSSQPQPQPQPVYYQQAPQAYQQASPSYAGSGSQPRKKILRKYDADGNVVSEEEVWE